MAGNANDAVVCIAQRHTATIDYTDARLLVRVLTDTKKAVREERVLLVRSDGYAYQQHTDEDGVARFEHLDARPGDWAFIVLPDVLEMWGDGDGVWSAARNEPYIGAMPLDLTHLRRFNKDEIDQLEKIAADDLNEKNLAKLNEAIAKRKAYRAKDATKYPVTLFAQGTTDVCATVDLVVARLSDDEKLQHIRDVFETNKAWYTAGKLNYDPTLHRWYVSGGAVCNQFANFFLGYWYNYNNGYTGGASSTDFLRQLENDSSRDRSNTRYPYRGFRDVVERPLAPPDGIPTSTHSGRVRREGGQDDFVYTRIREDDLEEYQGKWSFTHTWQEALAKYNVYSYASKRKGKIVYDHHGGLLIKHDRDGLLTFAADGSKSDAGVYSHTPLVVKPPKQILDGAKNRELHLLVWPMKPLRSGGYAPLDDQDGEYQTDAEMGAINNNAKVTQSSISPDFRHALSRFIVWDGAPNKP